MRWTWWRRPLKALVMVERKACWRVSLGAWPGVPCRIPLGAVLRAMALDLYRAR